MKSIDKTIAENISRLMELHGIKRQRQLALRANVSYIHLNRVMNLKKGAGDDLLAKLAKFFGVTVQEFYQEPGAPRVEDLPRQKMADLIRDLAHENAELKRQIENLKKPETAPSIHPALKKLQEIVDRAPEGFIDRLAEIPRPKLYGLDEVVRKLLPKRPADLSGRKGITDADD